MTYELRRVFGLWRWRVGRRGAGLSLTKSQAKRAALRCVERLRGAEAPPFGGRLV